MHRSVSQSNNANGVNGLNGHSSSRIASAADEFTMHKQHSISLSRATLTSREFGVEKTLTAMGILSLIAIILSSLSIVLLIQFNGMQSEVLNEDSVVVGVTGTRWYADILDSGVVLASFCLMLNLCCVVVCTGQSYFTAKMLKLPQGEDRSCEFLKNTSGTRFLAVCSFFVSIPIFLVALILYILLEFRTIPATVSSALIGLAVIFMIFSFGHNVRLWQREQSSISKRHAPPPGVFTGLNGGVHHKTNRNNQSTDVDGHHRFAFTNHVTGEGGDGGLDPLSISNLSTLV